MNKVSLSLEHCYGIRKLETTLDFSRSSTVAIYAPNGAMKSSLANTFQDIADGVKSKDRIFISRVTRREVKNELGADLAPSDVLVLRPYEEVSRHTESTATLLVNQTLRHEYEAIHVEVNVARNALIKALKDQSQTKKEIDREISSTFTTSDDEFDIALNRIKDELASQDDSPYSSVPYDIIMDDKVQEFLATGDFRTAIDAYVKRYNELLAESKYFKKGTFNYYNAANVAKQLKEGGFFEANHSVSLNADEKIEITSETQLEELINQEKARITSDLALRKKYEALEKKIHKNITLREFEAYLQEHENILPELENLAAFREKLWKSYIKVHYDIYLLLLEKLQIAAERTQQIQQQAAQERTLWEAVIELFNDRFIVPFYLTVANRVQVMLGQDTVPRLGFVFKDGEEEMPVEREALLKTLSTGEKKAFYVLNMLFNIEARLQSGQQTLVVVDDIADSFDYKNKYAIVQYLSDLAENPGFKLLILTHNFDFYRTIESRKLVQRNNCLMVSKSAQGVELQPAIGIKNIFKYVWKPHFYTDSKMKICCIPFMRNLIEYTKDDEDPDFIRLTSLLHWKPDSAVLTIGDLDQIYARLFDINGASPNQTDLAVDTIDTEARACLLADEGINFENKIILAIAIRLQAEKFMATKINDFDWLATINSNQTPHLLKRYRTEFSGENSNITVLQRVTLMTPENIHLNSFMYEPILDMSDQHLRRLFSDVLALT